MKSPLITGVTAFAILAAGCSGPSEQAGKPPDTTPSKASPSPAPAKPKKVFAIPESADAKTITITPYKARFAKSGGYSLERKPSGPKLTLTFAPDMTFLRITKKCDDYLLASGFTADSKGMGKNKCPADELAGLIKRMKPPLRVTYLPDQKIATKIVEFYPCQAADC